MIPKDKQCILCGGEDISIKEKIKVYDLKYLYKRYFEINILDFSPEAWVGKFIPLQKCADCGLEFFPPNLAGTDALYAALAKKMSYYKDEKWEFSVAARRFASAQSVLEVGCGDGHFLELLKKTDGHKKLVGLEFNSQAIISARKKGFEIHSEMVEDFARKSESADSFDAVASFQVLEHVPRPRAFLESCLKCLKKGGLLVIAVPNDDGFIKFATNDILNVPPHHLSRWNRSVIEYIAKKYGLKLISFETEPVAEYHKKGYRMAVLKKYIARFLGLKLGIVEYPWTIRYIVVKLLSVVCDAVIPKKFWKYKKFAGHTFCAIFEKL
ncbi:MAG: class I SAM-dependent methyltransferase [Patescibacteria group bacterium]